MATQSASRAPQASGKRVSAASVSGAEGARRVLAVLQAFSSRQHTLTARELAKMTAIPLPSMYRYIALLRDTGLLIGDDRGAYHLSPRFISMARAAEAAETLVELVDPVMRDLVRECGETAIFVRLIAGTPVCVHRVESEHHLRATFEPGQSLPALRGASGRVLLAGLPEQQRQECLASLAQADPAAAARLAEAIAEVAACGWATSEEEIDRGVWAASAAVTDGRVTVGALTVPSPLVRAPSGEQERLLGQVRTAAAKLSKLIGAARLFTAALPVTELVWSRYPARMPDFQSSSEIALEIPGTSIDITSSSVAALRQAMTDGGLTATALTQRYLDRIAEVNPVLGAVISVSPDALDQAAASDAAREAGQPRGLLEGIPVLVKDNIQVAGAAATAGSPALLGARPPDAFVISRLRAAGAIILAKANMSEWANFRSNRSTSGWSTVGGQVANPYALDRNPSGSSSGSAAGVSAGFAPLGLGTETDGSIVSPSSACGVVGIKPTLGLVSRNGIVPLSLAQDTAGPMATSVADAAVLLSVLAAPDPEDSASDHPGVIDYSACLDQGALEGARIGIWRAASEGADAATGALLEKAVRCLAALGAIVIDPVDLPGIDKVTEPEFEALPYEFKYEINAYLKYLSAFTSDDDAELPGTLADLIGFNERNANRVLARFGQEIFMSAEATSGDLADPAYLELRGAASSLARTAVETPMVEHRLDAIFSLTASPAWLTDYVLGDHWIFGTSRPGAVSGWPAITVPFGYVHGLPVGVSFLGPRWSESRLLALAYAFEQWTNARRTPGLLPSITPQFPG